MLCFWLLENCKNMQPVLFGSTLFFISFCASLAQDSIMPVPFAPLSFVSPQSSSQEMFKFLIKSKGNIQTLHCQSLMPSGKHNFYVPVLDTVHATQ